MILAISTTISVTTEKGSQPPDAFAYALGALIGCFVLVRRRWPVGVLVASVVTLQVYYLANYPGILPAVALAVPLYTAAAAGHLRLALAISAWHWVPPLIFMAFGVLGSRIEVLNDLVRDGALMFAAALFGDAMRSHRALMATTAERLRRAEEDRKREVQELNAARVIQQQLLPTELPSLSGWRIAACYQPARAVGGDFYDFLELPNGQLALVTGDVTDKGIPAALVMATTHSILRGDVIGLMSPGAILERANDRLYTDIPTHMFVTCLYVVLDLVSGRLRFANAGHNLPYVASTGEVTELRATGMPLGAMPGMTYEEKEAHLAPGSTILLSSDGLVEAHNPAGEMFGFPRLRGIIETSRGGEHLIDECLTALREFVGRDWEQEDDITLVTLQRDRSTAMSGPGHSFDSGRKSERDACRTLSDFALPSEPGNERKAMELVAAAVRHLNMSPARLERLKTAVAEATMNAMEHGNKYRSALPVTVRVLTSTKDLFVLITDRGGGPIPTPGAEAPDLEAKLEGLQSVRGWGLFLIRNMVDEMNVTTDAAHHTVELVMHLQGGDDASEPV